MDCPLLRSESAVVERNHSFYIPRNFLRFSTRMALFFSLTSKKTQTVGEEIVVFPVRASNRYVCIPHAYFLACMFVANMCPCTPYVEIHMRVCMYASRDISSCYMQTLHSVQNLHGSLQLICVTYTPYIIYSHVYVSLHMSS
jgi:hypothetical protein